MKVRLDDIDWKILKELQDDGRMTNVELSRRIGISGRPACAGSALEEAGIIQAYRALLDEKSLGYDLTAFAFVGLTSQSEAISSPSRAVCAVGRSCARVDAVGRDRFRPEMRRDQPPGRSRPSSSKS